MGNPGPLAPGGAIGFFPSGPDGAPEPGKNARLEKCFVLYSEKNRNPNG